MAGPAFTTTQLPDAARVDSSCDGGTRYGHRVDREWAIDRLTEFRENIDALRDLTDTSELEGEVIDNILMTYGTSSEVVDRLVTLDPVMRELMEAAQTGLGEYSDVTSGGYSIDNPDYWHDVVRPRVLRAIGIHSLGAEARKRMQPDSPDLAADQLHPWVWEAAAPLWSAGSRPRCYPRCSAIGERPPPADARPPRQVGSSFLPRVLQP